MVKGCTGGRSQWWEAARIGGCSSWGHNAAGGHKVRGCNSKSVQGWKGTRAGRCKGERCKNRRAQG